MKALMCADCTGLMVNIALRWHVPAYLARQPLP